MLATRFVRVVLFSLFSVSAFAESNPGWRELEQKNIGWERIMPPMGNATGKSKTFQGRTYSAYQLGLIDIFTDWIRKSSLPIGGLPQASRLALPDAIHEPPHVPQGTGVVMQFWAPSYNTARTKVTQAQPASAQRIAILANHIPGMEPASWYNTPEQYYFTMYYDPRGTALNAEDQAKMVPYLNEIKQAIGDRLVYFTGSQINVVLTPLPDLPIEQVTRAEVLDQGEAALKRAYQKRKLTDAQRAEYLGKIEELRGKYRSSLDQPAFVNNAQLGIYSFSKPNDLFEQQISNRYMFPVYRFKPEMYTLAKQDRPQWLAISWPYADAKAKTVTREIHQAMLRNFNFDYAYDYLYNSERVKNQPYKPRDADYLKAVDSRYEKPRE